MVRAHVTPVAPEQQARAIAKELRELERDEPGRPRASRLASLVRRSHEQRLLNLAMHAAQLCVDDDPEDPAELLRAYHDPGAELEEQLRPLQDLSDLARYVGHDELHAQADARLVEVARAWLGEATTAELRHRVRTLGSVLGRERADDLRAELDAGR